MHLALERLVDCTLSKCPLADSGIENHLCVKETYIKKVLARKFVMDSEENTNDKLLYGNQVREGTPQLHNPSRQVCKMELKNKQMYLGQLIQ